MSSLSAFAWVQSSLGIDITGEWNALVNFNVGGCAFSCQRRTFKCCADTSVLCQMALAQDQRGVTKTEDGSIILDRDPETFRHVLNFLRGGAQKLLLPDEFGDWDLLLDDARVYGLQGLTDAINSHPRYQQRCFKQSLPQGVMLRWTESPKAKDDDDAKKKKRGETGNGDDDEQPQSHPQHIELFPPMQLLEVDSTSGCLNFQGRTVGSVDEAVSILLFTFQMGIQTWHRDIIGHGSDARISHTIFLTTRK